MTGDDLLRYELQELERAAPGASPRPAEGRSPRRWFGVALVGATVVVAAAVTLVALGPLRSSPLGAASPSPNPPARAETRVGDFILTISSPKTVWTTDDAMDVSASLTYQGSESAAQIGAGVHPVVFVVKDIRSGEIVLNGAQLAICLRHDLKRGEPLRQPFVKSGEVTETGPFDEGFFADAALRMPPGEWQFTATASLSCDDAIQLEASIVLQVTTASLVSSAPPTPMTPESSETEPSPTPSMRACAAALAYGVLDADADGNPVLIMGDGMPTVSIVFSYPEDFVIESDPLLTIYDRDGNVLAREGDEVELGGGLNADDTIFHACGVISSDSNPPPSIECRMSAEDCDKALQAIVGVTDLRDPELQTVVVSGGTARTWHAEVHVCWSDGRYQLYDVMGPIGSDNPQLTTIPRAEMPPRLCD